MLKETIEGLLEACDCLCEFDPDTYGVVLPGLGQLKSRRFAENVQRSFMEIASGPFFRQAALMPVQAPLAQLAS